MSHLTSSAIQPGFSDPVLDSQAVFRLVLDAMAKPGTMHSVSDFLVDVPLGLHPATAACLLCLADYETPVFLPQWLQNSEVKAFLAFHTGAPVTNRPDEAAFAVVEGDSHESRLFDFATGDDRYPDRSATLLVQCALLEGGERVHLEGPGIKTRKTIAPSDLRHDFWPEVDANHALYPCGVDLILCSGDRLMALPRSTRIIREAC